MPNILGIFAKLPAPGQVKTRLAAATSPEFAARVADAMLLDTLHRFANVEAVHWLVYAPDDAAAAMAGYAGGEYQLTPQGDGDLGQRLQQFFKSHMNDAADRVVVIGADSPTLPVEYVLQAFDELKRADLVLGPATDGGYYLVGCSRQLPPIFDGIVWGGATVLRDTISRLGTTTRLALLPTWYDVDSLEDWQMLQGHLAAMRRSGLDPGVPRTESTRRDSTVR